MIQKISIPFLEICGEKIPTPIGLSELLENSWSTDVDMKEVNETVSQFERDIFKNENGKWVTRFKERKEMNPIENQHT